MGDRLPGVSQCRCAGVIFPWVERYCDHYSELLSQSSPHMPGCFAAVCLVVFSLHSIISCSRTQAPPPNTCYLIFHYVGFLCDGAALWRLVRRQRRSGLRSGRGMSNSAGRNLAGLRLSSGLGSLGPWSREASEAAASRTTLVRSQVASAVSNAAAGPRSEASVPLAAP